MRSASQLLLKETALVRPSNLREYVGELQKSDSVSRYHHIPAREPVLVEIPATLDRRLANVLAARGIERIYSHQLKAFELARNRTNFVVVTPTASGKTFCY